ncbi:hypothetical protein PILCRDRAFT_4807 [Piloderma croceum F 1598]|uniref:Uncharacterized protein n=1 Tax=Piloderma croceum (strain F 1598) TaxID=765440 RepID=A0A0C3G6I9_PILCF|nr:hypothetical protein PILCRDRAFT_4807 [Piloderma croceum F 1598]
MHDPATTTTSYAPPPHPYATSPVATRSPPRVSRTHNPAPTTTLYTPPPHPYPLSPVTVSHGVPETEPQRLGFRFWTQTPSLPCVSRTHNPATTTTSYTPPPHPYPLSPIIVSHGVPETEPQWLDFGFWTQTCSPPHIS